MGIFQIQAPQVIDLYRQVKTVQIFLDVCQLQGMNILRRTVHQGLAQQPAPLKGITEIKPVRAPDKMAGRMNNHIDRTIP
ncbi:MAG: hypothetical protein HXY24_10460 [Rubrivivax sp.]|nr:hypothetical protein [Rubrivivax sp.]